MSVGLFFYLFAQLFVILSVCPAVYITCHYLRVLSGKQNAITAMCAMGGTGLICVGSADCTISMYELGGSQVSC